MLNSQKPEPQIEGLGMSLDVHSVFTTIQGEGPLSGHRAIFVRLAGCNLQCPGCDTEYTEGRRKISIEKIITPETVPPAELVVITGGEPLRQPIGRFVAWLIATGFTVQIESNGLLPPDPILHDILTTGRVLNFHGEIEDKRGRLLLVVSPKTSRINEMTGRLATAFKYVLRGGELMQDGLPERALEHPAKGGVARPPVRWRGPIYVTPYDEQRQVANERNYHAVASSVLKHGYIGGLQIHKLIGVA